jgi:hypothetical protein
VGDYNGHVGLGVKCAKEVGDLGGGRGGLTGMSMQQPAGSTAAARGEYWDQLQQNLCSVCLKKWSAACCCVRASRCSCSSSSSHILSGCHKQQEHYPVELVDRTSMSAAAAAAAAAANRANGCRQLRTATAHREAQPQPSSLVTDLILRHPISTLAPEQGFPCSPHVLVLPRPSHPLAPPCRWPPPSAVPSSWPR